LWSWLVSAGLTHLALVPSHRADEGVDLSLLGEAFQGREKEFINNVSKLKVLATMTDKKKKRPSMVSR